VCELGYTTHVPIPEDAGEDYLESGYEYTFDSPAGKNLLELQWALQPRFYSVDFDMDGLFKRAVNVTVAGRRVKTPSAEDLLLVLSVHAAKHVWGRLIWLCDITRILKRENLDWDWVQSQAQELGIQKGPMPAQMLRGVDTDVPTFAMRDHTVTTSTALSDENAFQIARAIDEHPSCLQEGAVAFSYNPRTGTNGLSMPMHPGAEAYYRTQGYLD